VSEPKPFASLSSGLLARKGAARPAMRPQGFGQVGQGLEDLGWDDMGFDPPKPAEVARDLNHDAFGGNLADHARVHPTGLTPVQSPVHSQQAELAARVAEIDADEFVEEDSDDSVVLYEPSAVPEPVVALEVEPVAEPVSEAVAGPVVRPAIPRRAPRPRAAAGSKAKAAFTLRLAPDRHLKLRLACAIDGRSAQHLVTDALDQWLAKMPELEAMAARAKSKG
jgi:hypothetical protein